MPDPLLLLGQGDFLSEYAAALRVAEFYGVGVRRDGTQVFFEFKTPQGRFVARLECGGYPAVAPDLVFLDPETEAVSADRNHWPPGGAVLHHPDGWHVCIPGTRWFERTHRNRGTRKDRSFSRILEVLAVCCSGRAQGLMVGRRR